MGALSELGFDESRLTEIVKIHDESRKWMYDNFSEIQDLYESKFIAIYRKNIIADDKDKGNLYRKLRENFEETQIQEIYIHYINPKGYFFILSL